MTRSSTGHCGNTRVERTPNKSQQRKSTLERKIFLLEMEPATCRSRVCHSTMRYLYPCPITDRHRHTQIDRQTHTHTDTHTQTNGQTDRHRNTRTLACLWNLFSQINVGMVTSNSCPITGNALICLLLRRYLQTRRLVCLLSSYVLFAKSALICSLLKKRRSFKRFRMRLLLRYKF